MEILSFVLGMSVVVVIAVSVVSVIGFVKARKIEKELENNVFSQLDSRLDKLEQKLINKK